MNAEGIDTDAQTVEPMLADLIRQHGLEAVEATLGTLFGRAKLADYQRVQNIARNVARRLDRLTPQTSP